MSIYDCAPIPLLVLNFGVAPSQRMLAVKHEVMGFFSSKRPEQLEEHLNNDSTVVRVIRSRFVRVLTPENSHSLLPLLTLAFTSASMANRRARTAKCSKTLRPFRLLKPLLHLLRYYIPPTISLFTTQAVHGVTSQLLPPLSVQNLLNSLSLPKQTALQPMLSRSCIPMLFVASALNVSCRITLAQRLNELAVANSQGLLE